MHMALPCSFDAGGLGLSPLSASLVAACACGAASPQFGGAAAAVPRRAAVAAGHLSAYSASPPRACCCLSPLFLRLRFRARRPAPRGSSSGGLVALTGAGSQSPSIGGHTPAPPPVDRLLPIRLTRLARLLAFPGALAIGVRQPWAADPGMRLAAAPKSLRPADACGAFPYINRRLRGHPFRRLFP